MTYKITAEQKKEIGEVLGCSIQHVRGVLKAERRLSLKKLLKVEKVYGIDTKILISGTGTQIRKAFLNALEAGA